MNKKLGLAVAGAVMALSSAAQAGIVIPAGDWTIDIGGNVNAFYTRTKFSGDLEPNTGSKTAQVVQTGLLPSAIGIGGKTRQNDIDVAFQFTFFTGVDSGTGGAAGNNTLNIRQAFLTFGDSSWGQIKLGRDLGVFGSDAILSDMTLLGVGVGAGAGGSSTLGRIGSGYLYADWVGQVQYQSPNFNGLQFTAAVREPWTNGDSNQGWQVRQDMGYEGKVTYDFAAKGTTGRVWASAFTERHDNGYYPASYTARAVDLGGKIAANGLEAVAYYYNGKNMNSSLDNLSGIFFFGSADRKTDNEGGYVQATYKLPDLGTKLGFSYGESRTKIVDNSSWKNKSTIVGAYHPLTKSLNLVAEYTDNKFEGDNDYGLNARAKTVSLGAIMFF
jgi:predicted porin